MNAFFTRWVAERATQWSTTPYGPLVVAAGSAVCCASIAAADPETPGGIIPVCPTRSIFGLWCPGCGSMRMIAALTRGDVASALAYNAMGVVGVILLVWSWVHWLGSTVGVSVPDWTAWRYSAHVTGVVIAGWFLIRNLPWEPFASLRV